MKRLYYGLLEAVKIGATAVVFSIIWTFFFSTATMASGLGASYSAFYSKSGWGIWNMDNTVAMQGDSYISALRLGLYGQPAEWSGTILYQVNVSGSGWLDWAENGAETGRTDLMREPLESVRVKLSGDLEAQYDVYTKVFQNDNRWTSWVKNGEDAGTSGVGTHIRGIRIVVKPKGSEAPSDDEIDPGRPMIALTFDDGPTVHTSKFLDVLEKYNARATFFVLGSNLNKNHIPIVQRAASLGNEIGNHTVSHPRLTRRSASAIRAQIDGVTPVIAGITGTQPKLLRPPYGEYDQQVLKQLAQTGYACIMWSVDTLDWKTRNADNTVNVVLGKAKDGDIVLMHDSQPSSAMALERIVKGLQARGFQLVTVSELARYRGGTLAGQVYNSFR